MGAVVGAPHAPQPAGSALASAGGRSALASAGGLAATAAANSTLDLIMRAVDGAHDDFWRRERDAARERRATAGSHAPPSRLELAAEGEARVAGEAREPSVQPEPIAAPAPDGSDAAAAATSGEHALRTARRWLGWIFYGDFVRWAGRYDLGEAYTAAALGTFALLLWSTLSIMLANLRQRREDPLTSAGGGVARFDPFRLPAAAPGGSGAGGSSGGLGGDGGGGASGKVDGSSFTSALCTAVDFNCTEPEAVRVGIQTALLEMRERLYGESLSEEWRSRSLQERLRQLARHAFGSLVSLLLVCVYLLAVVYACDKDVALASIPYGTPVFLATLKLATPMAVRFVISLEGYTDAGEIVKQVCIRVYVIKMANLFIALVGIHDTLQLSACPNTTSGEFMLKLYAADLVFSVGFTLVYPLVTFHMPGGGLQDYDISYPLIDLYYRQAMALLGVYTCPAMLFAFVAGETVYFYLTVLMLQGYYRRPLRPFALAQGENFMHSLSALTTTIALVGTIWLMRHPCALSRRRERARACRPDHLLSPPGGTLGAAAPAR
jgi:uncharacterized membrane protein YgcG